MGKRGRKSKPIRLEIGGNLAELRYASLAEALTDALPILAEMISQSEKITANTKANELNHSRAETPAPTNKDHNDLID